MRVPHNESQTILPTQQLSGSAVVTIPRGYQLQPGYQYPQPVYDADLGRASALFPTLSQDDFRFIMLGIFVLLALAIVTRK